MKTRPENVLGIHRLFFGSDPGERSINADNCDAPSIANCTGKARRSVARRRIGESVFSRKRACYRRPVKARIITIKRIKPSPPLGQYPQPELYGQAGSAPTKSRITMINRMVPIGFSFPALYSSTRSILDALRHRGSRRTVQKGRLSTDFDFFCLDAHRVFGRFNFAPRSIGIHLGKLGTEKQNLR